jgi:hypothetical protein
VAGEIASWAWLGALVLLLAGLLARPLQGWFATPSLSIHELRACRRLDEPTGPVKSFFEWREAQWTSLAKGLGAAGVTLLAALLAAQFSGSKNSLKVVPDAALRNNAIAIGAFWLAAVVAWYEAQLTQRGFIGDVARLMSIPEP